MGRVQRKPAKAKPAAAKAKGREVAAMPDFVAPQLCASVDRPPNGEGWCHEIKFDGYRVQLRVEDGDAVLKTRKGLDWTDKFPAIAKEGSALPDMLIDGEIVALDHDGAPDFSTLQAAISDGKTDRLIFFAFDLLFAEGEDLRRPAARRSQGAVEANCWRRGPRARQRIRSVDPLCRTFRKRRRRHAAIGLQAVAGRHRLQEAQRALSVRPLRRAGPRPNAAPGRRSCSAAGRPPTANSAR